MAIGITSHDDDEPQKKVRAKTSVELKIIDLEINETQLFPVLPPNLGAGTGQRASSPQPMRGCRRARETCRR